MFHRFVAIFHSHVKLLEGRWHSQWLSSLHVINEHAGAQPRSSGTCEPRKCHRWVGTASCFHTFVEVPLQLLIQFYAFSHRVWSDKWKCIQLYDSAAKWDGKPYHYPSMFYLLLGSIRFVVCSFTEPWSCQQKIHRCDAAMVDKNAQTVGGCWRFCRNPKIHSTVFSRCCRWSSDLYHMTCSCFLIFGILWVYRTRWWSRMGNIWPAVFKNINWWFPMSQRTLSLVCLLLSRCQIPQTDSVPKQSWPVWRYFIVWEMDVMVL